MTDPIKAKIQELCPDVEGDYCTNSGCEHEHKVVTLAVVLRAIDKKDVAVETYIQYDLGALAIGRDFHEDENSYAHWCYWNLEHDNYDAQSQETKDFIGRLLGVN